MFRDLCVNGACENAYGIFTCSCNQGYKLDGGGGNCTGKLLRSLGSYSLQPNIESLYSKRRLT